MQRQLFIARTATDKISVQDDTIRRFRIVNTTDTITNEDRKPIFATFARLALLTKVLKPKTPMTHSHPICITADRETAYKALLPQIEALVGYETDPIANMANIAAALKEALGLLWIGFYLVKGEELVVGPFQGPVACSRIKYGAGVCGTAWKEQRTIVVPNVDEFEGHIACNAHSKSEIVVPLLTNRSEIVGVLDIDSDKLADFNDIDAMYLKLICLIYTNSLR